jgi:streptogramin lyase
MARPSCELGTGGRLERHAGPLGRAGLALHLIAALCVPCAAGQGKSPPAQSAPKADGNDQKPTVAKGEIVAELDKAIFHVFHAKDNTYWFGSHEQGLYRYGGKAITRYTTKDGLNGNRVGGIQEDKSGNIYIDGEKGISKFDGHAFTTLSVTAGDRSKSEWKLQPDDLWFVGGQDTGEVYRYDGRTMRRLAFPATKAGDDFLAMYPRSKFPNAKFSPYDVYRIFKDSKGNLWFGTAILGVCRYDGKSFTWLPEEELRNGSFGARSIVEDKDGKFWFSNCLHRFAVDLSDPAKPSFKKEKGLRDTRDPTRLPFGGIMSSIVDPSGALWMATYGEGVWRYDGTNLTQYPVTVGGKGITLITVSQDNQGVLWLGTHSAGALKFNGKTFEKFRQ